MPGQLSLTCLFIQCLLYHLSTISYLGSKAPRLRWAWVSATENNFKEGSVDQLVLVMDTGNAPGLSERKGTLSSCGNPAWSQAPRISSLLINFSAGVPVRTLLEPTSPTETPLSFQVYEDHIPLAFSIEVSFKAF